MTIKIKVKSRQNQRNIRVRVMKAPFVDSRELERVVYERQKATVL